jgi:hypothetical protein
MRGKVGFDVRDPGARGWLPGGELADLGPQGLAFGQRSDWVETGGGAHRSRTMCCGRAVRSTTRRPSQELSQFAFGDLMRLPDLVRHLGSLLQPHEPLLRCDLCHFHNASFSALAYIV